MRKRCDCGAKVKNHHMLCDRCWGKKARQKDRDKKKTINKKGIRNINGSKKQIIHYNQYGNYLCNWSVKAKKEKISKDWKKINCKNCKKTKKEEKC